MRSVVSVVLLALFLSACSQSSSDGSSSSVTRSDPSDPLTNSGLCGENFRITNGESCQNPRGSSVARLIMDIDGVPAALCSGTLITSNTILTAAHCIDYRVGFTTGVVGFPIDGKTEFDVYEIDHMVQHPVYDGTGGDPYDIGIIVLRQPVIGRNPIPLIGPDAHRSGSGDTVGIYGYGMDQNGESGALRSGRMILGDFGIDFGYPDTLLQAQFDATNQSICSGDSGGPVAGEANGFVGIVGISSAGGSSDGAFTCAEGSYALFTDTQVDSNLNFILENKSGPLTLIGGNGAGVIP